jgi:hypothetical protein
LTPLYHFASDVPDLVIDSGLRIHRFSDSLPIPSIDILAKHLQVYEPDYLLLHDPLLSGDFPWREFLEASKDPKDYQKIFEVIELFIAPTAKLFGAMRLFKPGLLRAGQTYLVWRNKDEDSQGWRTLGTGRASMMAIDYHVLEAKTTSYVLQSAELPLLFAFREHLAPVLTKLASIPQLEYALELYGADNGERSDAVGAVTALEALLAKKEETEGLTYRLSMRIANLLGKDVEERKGIFRDVKNFYHLRSKIVHGVELDAKLLSRLSELDRLRETLRKVLLSVMALFLEGFHIPDLPDLMDDLAFDDEKRQRIQATASKVLGINVGKTV